MQIEIRITAETFGELMQKLNAALQELMPPAIEQAASQTAGAEQEEQVPVVEPERRRRKTPVDKSDPGAKMDHQTVEQAVSEPEQTPSAAVVAESPAPVRTADEVRKLALDVAQRHSGRTTAVVEAIVKVAGVKTLAEVPAEKLSDLYDTLQAL